MRLKLICGFTFVVLATLIGWAYWKPTPVANAPAVNVPMATSAPKDAPVASADPAPVSPERSAERVVLAPESLQRLNTWAHDRGYPFDVVGQDAKMLPRMSAYDSMDEQALQQLSQSGDKHASFVLGSRILDNQQKGLPPAEEYRRAMQYLEKATAMGYTSSLERMVEAKSMEAGWAGIEKPIGATWKREALVQGYVYAYTLERRGSPSIHTAFSVLESTDRLTPGEDARARKGADDYYARLESMRRDSGLPPFTNGVPADVQNTYNQIMAIYGLK